MKTPIEQFIDETNAIRLSGEEKARIHSRLVAHMRANPIPAKPVATPYQSFFGVLSPFAFLLRMPVAALALILLVTVGGATTFAAQGALPGNPLYPLKVRVIEPVKGLMAVSAEEKAAWQVSLVEARVSEVEQLALKAKLTPEEGLKSQERFDRSLQTARETIQRLSEDNPNEAKKIEDSFTVSLDVHEDTLDRFGDSASSNAREARAFADHMRDSKHTGNRDSGDKRESDKK